VPRNEIMSAVWGDAVIGYNTFNMQVSFVRKALGDDAIITVPNRGLRFGFEVEAQGSTAT